LAWGDAAAPRPGPAAPAPEGREEPFRNALVMPDFERECGREEVCRWVGVLVRAWACVSETGARRENVCTDGLDSVPDARTICL
jgi:hypothetical protein